mgnify:CR=1 FL=1
MQIGFIGVGAMGGGLARNLIRAGKSVLIYDINAATVEKTLAAGTTLEGDGTISGTVTSTGGTIAPGDSFRIRGEPFCYSNPYTHSAVVIWVIAPPVY